MGKESYLIRSAVFLTLIFCLFGTVFAEMIPSTEPCWIKGTVQGDGFDINNVTIGAYSGNTLLKSQVLVASEDNNAVLSLNSIGATTGDLITIKVLGAPFDDFNFVGYCKTEDDPWIILDEITISEQANGVTCTDDSICSSGYCDDTCKNRPTGGDNGGTGGSGGTIVPGTTTISETTTIVTPTADEIEDSLDGVYSPEEISDIISNIDDYEFTQTILVQKIVSATGAVTYKTTVTVTAKNTSNKNLKDVVVVVVVPKEVAKSASQITSLLSFKTIIDDPVLEFTIPSLKAGQDAEIIYTATTTTKVDVNKIEFAEPVIKTATVVEDTPTKPVTPGTDTNKPTTPEPQQPGTQGTTTPPDYTMVILGIVVLLAIVGAAYFIMKNKKGNNAFGFK